MNSCVALYDPVKNKMKCLPGHWATSFQEGRFGTTGFSRTYNRLHSPSNVVWYNDSKNPNINTGLGNYALWSKTDDTSIHCQGYREGAVGMDPVGANGAIEKIDRQGNIVWGLGGSDTDDGGGILHMAYLPNGNIVACGTLKDGVDPYNILIIDPEAGTIVQRLTATLSESYYSLFKVAADEIDSSFVVVGKSNDTTENVFKYTPNSSGVYPSSPTWSVNTADDDTAYHVMIASNGDVIVGVDFNSDVWTYDANYYMYVFDKDGNLETKWRPPEAEWVDSEFPPTKWWINLETKQVYDGFISDSGDVYYSGPISVFEEEGEDDIDDYPVYKYTSSYNYSDTISFTDMRQPRSFVPTSTSKFWACEQISLAGGLLNLMMFDTSTDTITPIMLGSSGTAETHIPPVPGFDVHRIPLMLTKGAGHTFPLFKRDNPAYIDHTTSSYKYDEDVDYYENNILLCGNEFNSGDPVDRTPSNMAMTRVAQQDGNPDEDRFSYYEGRHFTRRNDADSGPAPFRTLFSRTRKGYLVYSGGNYYKAKENTSWQYAVTNTTWWTPVSAPDPTWDSYDGYGSKGGDETSPQAYTVAFAGVEDYNDDPHPINGSYHCSKHFNIKSNFWTGGIYRFITMGWLGNKEKLEITFNLNLNIFDQTYETVVSVTSYADVPLWQSGDSYDIGEKTKTYVPTGGPGSSEQLTYYISTADDNVLEPPDTGWSSLGTPPPSDSIFELTLGDPGIDGTNNFGTVMNADVEGNENTTTGTNGHAGTVSWYPGKHKPWSATVTYIADDIVAHEGRFYQASSGSTDDEPPSGNWTALT